MEKQEHQRHKKKASEEKTLPGDHVSEEGEKIEKKLEKLDQLIDEALEENEESAERRAQEFVDEFKQKGGE